MSGSTTLRFVYKGRTVMVGPVDADTTVDEMATRVLAQHGVASDCAPRLFVRGQVLEGGTPAAEVPVNAKILIHPADADGVSKYAPHSGSSLSTLFSFWQTLAASSRGVCAATTSVLDNWVSFIADFSRTMFSAVPPQR